MAAKYTVRVELTETEDIKKNGHKAAVYKLLRRGMLRIGFKHTFSQNGRAYFLPPAEYISGKPHVNDSGAMARLVRKLAVRLHPAGARVLLTKWTADKIRTAGEFDVAPIYHLKGSNAPGTALCLSPGVGKKVLCNDLADAESKIEAAGGELCGKCPWP